jgi:hypothetical protein
MSGASIEATLELWASSLREVKGLASVACAGSRSNQRGIIPRRFTGNERRKTGWIRAEAAGDPGPLGGSRHCWAATGGTPMHCATWCASMSLSISLMAMPCWSSMKPASSIIVRRDTAVHGVGREDHELPDRRVRYLRVAPQACFHRSELSRRLYHFDGSWATQSMVPATSSETCARPVRDICWMSNRRVSFDPEASHEPLREPPPSSLKRWERLNG